MVAASKMRTAQEKTVAGKPYKDSLVAIVRQLIGRSENESHPYLETRTEGKTLLVVFSPERGLCGSLPTNLLREYVRIKREEGNFDVIVIGRKLQGSLRYLGANILASFDMGSRLPTFEQVFPVMTLIKERFDSKEYKKVIVLYPDFVSVNSQRPTLYQLLPVVKEDTEEQVTDFTFEPDAQTLLTALLPHYVEMVLYQFMLETYASEQTAKMMAMHQASENASELIESLTLFYNKARQEKITGELLDLVTATMVV